MTTFRSQYTERLVRLMHPSAFIEPLPHMNAYRIVHVITYDEVVAARDNRSVLVDKIEPRRLRKRRLHWGKKH